MSYLNELLPRELVLLVLEYSDMSVIDYFEKEYNKRVEFCDKLDIFYDILIDSFIRFKGFDIMINDIRLSDNNSLLLFQFLNDNDSKVSICYEEEIVMYITDSNWNKYKKEYNEYKKIILFGPVESIGDNWLCCCKKLESINFLGLNGLKYIGDYWLSFCSELKVVNFIGLSNLVYVGYNWLNSSNKLLIFDFSLLSGLSIDYQFIRNLKIISK